MDSTEQELYDYDIPDWFKRAWVWLLQRYPGAKKGSADQTYWHNLRGLNERLLKRAIVRATEDDPDKFPECKRIQSIYNAIMGTNFKTRYQKRMDAEHGPCVPPNEAQVIVWRKYCEMLRSMMSGKMTKDEGKAQTRELMKEYKAAEFGVPAREKELQIDYQ